MRLPSPALARFADGAARDSTLALSRALALALEVTALNVGSGA